jgi:creatinine amidohydrolase
MLLQELHWPDVSRIDRDVPVIIPVAALEQHGHHMPLFTDSLLLGEVLRRTDTEIGSRILQAPLMWLGNSHHHMDQPGTLSADPRVYLDLLSGLADNFIQHGFRRIVFLNGHGGNDVPGRQAVFELRQKYRRQNDLLLLFGTYWLLGDQPPASIDGLVQAQMGHAGEWETSMMLAAHEHLVGDYQQALEVPFGNPFLPANRGWIMPDRSVPGHVGVPAAATKQKGEALLNYFAGNVVSLLTRVVDWDGESWDG